MVFLLLILQWQLRHDNTGEGGLQAAKEASLSTNSLLLTVPGGMQKIQVTPSFFILIRASRDIHHRPTHIWAGIEIFKKGGKSGIDLLLVGGKREYNPSFR